MRAGMFASTPVCLRDSQYLSDITRWECRRGEQMRRPSVRRARTARQLRHVHRIMHTANEHHQQHARSPAPLITSLPDTRRSPATTSCCRRRGNGLWENAAADNIRRRRRRRGPTSRGVPTDRTLSTRASNCLLYTSPSPRDRQKSRMPSSA